MKCDIYQSEGIKNAYLFLKSGLIPDNQVPITILKNLGTLEYFKTIDFDANSSLIAADPREVINNIKKNGYHIQGAEIRIETKAHKEISEAGAAIGGGILAASLGFGPIGSIMGALAGVILAASAKGDKDDPDA